MEELVLCREERHMKNSFWKLKKNSHWLKYVESIRIHAKIFNYTLTDTQKHGYGIE